MRIDMRGLKIIFLKSGFPFLLGPLEWRFTVGLNWLKLSFLREGERSVRGKSWRGKVELKWGRRVRGEGVSEGKESRKGRRVRREGELEGGKRVEHEAFHQGPLHFQNLYCYISIILQNSASVAFIKTRPNTPIMRSFTCMRQFVMIFNDFC